MRHLLLILLLAVPAFGQEADFEEVTAYEIGMMEPTPPDVRAVAIELLALGATDRFIEIGCGDGRVLVDAMLKTPASATAVGVEIDPALSLVARMRVREAGLNRRVKVATADARLIDMSSFTAAYVYLGGYDELTREIAPKLVGKRVVSIGHELPGMTGGEKFSHVWLYREAKLAPQAAVAPAVAATEKPVLTVVMAPSNMYCQACETLKADIAAGKLSQYNIRYETRLKGRSYPEIRFTNGEGNLQWFNGWPAWASLPSVTTVATKTKTKKKVVTVAQRASKPTWTYGGRTYSVFGYTRCGWAGCPMCKKWERVRSQYP